MTSTKDFKRGETVGYCPDCGSELVIRKGKYGLFIGCKGFPNCKKTYNYETFRVQPEGLETKKINQAKTYEQIKEIMDNTENPKIKEKCEIKLLEMGLCTCGKKLSPHKIYRTTPDYPHYLKEYHCPEHGYFIMTQTPHHTSFCRYGRLYHHPADEEILGGYWI